MMDDVSCVSLRPERAYINRCNALGLIDRCVKIEPRPATKRELLYEHTADHIALLRSTQGYDADELERLSSKYDSIYIHPVSGVYNLSETNEIVPNSRLNVPDAHERPQFRTY